MCREGTKQNSYYCSLLQVTFATLLVAKALKFCNCLCSAVGSPPLSCLPSTALPTICPPELALGSLKLLTQGVCLSLSVWGKSQTGSQVKRLQFRVATSHPHYHPSQHRRYMFHTHKNRVTERVSTSETSNTRTTPPSSSICSSGNTQVYTHTQECHSRGGWGLQFG